MITVSGRKVDVPSEERFIGFEGDNAVHSVTIKVLNMELSGFDFKIDVMQKTKNILEPEKINEEDGILLIWNIKKEHLQCPGILSAQVRAFADSDLIWHSDIFEFDVKFSINAAEAFPDPLPSEFEQIEKSITAAKKEAVEAAEVATEKAKTLVYHPYIGKNKNWYIWSYTKNQYVDSGFTSVGEIDESDLVHKNGDEVISGTKKFIGDVFVKENQIATTDLLPTKTSELENDGDGTNKFVTFGDYADNKGNGGLVKIGGAMGISVNAQHQIMIDKASNTNIDDRSGIRPIVPSNLEYAVKSVGDGYYKKEATQVTEGTEIALADNTEYRLTDVKTLTLTYPTGNFECWMSLGFADEGDITVTLPASSYVGAAPVFANGETWEMSIKDGVIVSAKVGDGT